MNIPEFLNTMAFKHDLEFHSSGRKFFYNGYFYNGYYKCKRCDKISDLPWTYGCITDDEYIIKNIIE